MDSYLASNDQDANLVGGPGSAGYDEGFWIKGGDFSLKINLTLQARYEAWLWDDSQKALLATNPPFDTAVRASSGFSLPRATLKFSGTAPVQHQLLHGARVRSLGCGTRSRPPTCSVPRAGLGVHAIQSPELQTTRAKRGSSGRAADAFNFRMGQIRTATTRQAMISPRDAAVRRRLARHRLHGLD